MKLWSKVWYIHTIKLNIKYQMCIRDRSWRTQRPHIGHCYNPTLFRAWKLSNLSPSGISPTLPGMFGMMLLGDLETLEFSKLKCGSISWITKCIPFHVDCFPRAAIPVSYTHLDVYKRQVVNTQSCAHREVN